MTAEITDFPSDVQEPLEDWRSRVVIRRLTSVDLPGLEWDGEFTHYRRVYLEAYRRMCSGKSILWVAELPGWGLIAQVFVQLNCDRKELANGNTHAYFYAFRVRPRFRNAGLGTRMLEVVEEDLKLRGFSVLTLNVARTNVDAQRLYERLGYQITAPESGRWSYPDHDGIWHDVEEPAWRMEKKLV
jgi:ribosomal protein S18 acetylase RimI-like enzyme